MVVKGFEADYESAISFSKCKMADPIWRTKMSKTCKILQKICISMFFGSLIMNLLSIF